MRKKRERDEEDGSGNSKKVKMELNQGDGTSVHVEDPSSLNANIQDDGSNTMTSSSNTKVEETPPSNILFAESLPKDCNEMMLACLFRSYPGYNEVRIPRAGLAFIEFDDEPHASVALKALNGFSLSATETLNLKYGKA